MPPRGVPGIYGIRCLLTGHVYVGSAKKIEARLRHHRHRLRDGKEHNKVLQFAYDIFGEEEFAFEQLELCDESLLKEREDWHIQNSPGPLFNIVRAARRIKHSAEGRVKLSEKAKRQHQQGQFGQSAWRTDRAEVYRRAGESNSKRLAGKIPNFEWTTERKGRVAEAMRQRRAREKAENVSKVQT